jgi:hypothetical protein
MTSGFPPVNGSVPTPDSPSPIIPPKTGNILIAGNDKPISPTTPETPGKIQETVTKADTIGSPLSQGVVQEASAGRAAEATTNPLKQHPISDDTKRIFQETSNQAQVEEKKESSPQPETPSEETGNVSWMDDAGVDPNTMTTQTNPVENEEATGNTAWMNDTLVDQTIQQSPPQPSLPPTPSSIHPEPSPLPSESSKEIILPVRYFPPKVKLSPSFSPTPNLATALKSLLDLGLSGDVKDQLIHTGIYQEHDYIKSLPPSAHRDNQITLLQQFAKQQGTSAFQTTEIGPVTVYEENDFAEGVTQEELPKFIKDTDWPNIPNGQRIKEGLQTGKIRVRSRDQLADFEKTREEEWLRLMGRFATFIQKFVDTYKAEQKRKQEANKPEQPAPQYQAPPQILAERRREEVNVSKTHPFQQFSIREKRPLRNLEEFLYEMARFNILRQKKEDKKADEKQKERVNEDIKNFENRQNIIKGEIKGKGKKNEAKKDEEKKKDEEEP